MLSNAGAIVTSEDRRFGLEDRDYVAGVTLGHRLLADVVTQSIISWAQLVVFFSLFHLIYGMEVRGMFEIAVGLAYLTAIVGLTIGRFDNFGAGSSNFINFNTPFPLESLNQG